VTRGRREPEVIRVDLETGDFYLEHGWCPHSYVERVAICRESGIDLREARRTAAADEARRSYERMGHGGR
jgi:hypothetical protein